MYSNTAFIGLGAMGYGMARHLKKITSERVFVYNRTTAVARAFCEENSNENFEVASDLKDLSSVSVVCICLPSTDVVAKVCEDLMSILKPGTIIIDSTSGEPNKAIQIATQLKTKGIHYIDAPVSGGPHGAKAGALTVMVGGNNPEILQQSIEFLSNSYGKKVFAVGEVGSAHAVKAINNALNASHLLIASEGLCALKAMGIAPAVALSIINNSSGRSLQTEARLPEKVLTRSFDYGFKIGLMKKDVGIANKILDSTFPRATFMRQTNDILKNACEELGANADYTECVKIIEKRSNIVLD